MVGYWDKPFTDRSAASDEIKTMGGSNGGVRWKEGNSYSRYPCTAGFDVGGG